MEKIPVRAPGGRRQTTHIANGGFLIDLILEILKNTLVNHICGLYGYLEV